MKTDHEINEAIAMKCGWIRTEWEHHQMPYWKNPDGKPDSLPNYCSDLNAMHEAEKSLTGLDAFRYTQNLWRVIQPNVSANYDTEKHVCATARQRTEAFCRTVGISLE